jgi:hypothetical protein
MKPVFHYTTKDRVEMILAAGEIKTATAGVKPPEILAVWLSTAAKWEHTATKILVRSSGRPELGTLAGMIAAGATLARIQIDPARVSLIQAREIQNALNVPPAIHKALTRSAKQCGANPAEWRAVAGPIPVSAFLSIEFSAHCQPFEWLAFNPAAAKSAAA